MSTTASPFDDVAGLRTRLANLRTPDGYALGVERDGAFWTFRRPRRR